ncbi:Coiled-coil domain-containing protein 96 [Acipenser ruthenus]|uniref:Coiled-coil domain-containing protein 96 n=1 Tax=Acipenser ruthenus TaxID=7906 RepID=A0A444UM91_ACIRT|nr:Coiled-coil domain-containing protein 96 [Acipenser ruthenus]
MAESEHNTLKKTKEDAEDHPDHPSPAQEADESPPEDEEKEKENEREEPPSEPAESEGASEKTGEAQETDESGEKQTSLPTSEAFGEGESDEPQPVIGEPLSRQDSPVRDLEQGPPKLEPGTPERPGSLIITEESIDEEEEEGQTINREEILAKYKALMEEKEQLNQLNGQIQNKLAEYFRRKAGDDARHEKEKPVSDQEQRYLKYMATMEELKWQYAQDSEAYQLQIDDLKSHCQGKLSLVDSEGKTFMAKKKDIAVAAMRRRLGKQAALNEVEQILASEQRKECDLIQVRLANIKLKNKIRKFEAMLKEKEELAEGLHLIDFEQLKIENQTYNEKIEERNEELLKLRKKITSTVQVLTHVKEKLQFVQVENQDKKAQLMDVEAMVAHKRDILTKTKQARDGLRMDNLKLRQKCGLLGNEALLQDFEDKVDASEALSQRLEMLKRRHAELTLKCSGIKKKIDQAKPSH